MKTCGKCKAEYPTTSEYFRQDASRKDGLFPWCKKCKNEADNKFYHKNIEEIHKKRKEWRDNHKETKREQDRQYREKMKNREPSDIAIPEEKICTCCHKTKISDKFFKDMTSKDGLTGYCKKCTKTKNGINYQKHKDERKVQGREYRDSNKIKISKRQKTYALNHKKSRNKYLKNRKQNDLNYKILCNLRSRLSTSLKDSKKSDHTMNLVGCTIDKLKKHLESQFDSNMNFSNYGFGNDKWSLDHMRPCASFDLSDPEQQKICFHYSNIQPLWNVDNFKKNSFYNGKYIRKISIRK